MTSEHGRGVIYPEYWIRCACGYEEPLATTDGMAKERIARNLGWTKTRYAGWVCRTCQPGSASGSVGVYYEGDQRRADGRPRYPHRPWKAVRYVQRKPVFIGRYATKEEAETARQNAINASP